MSTNAALQAARLYFLGRAHRKGKLEANFYSCRRQKGAADAKEHKYCDILCRILNIPLFCGYYFNVYNLQAI